MKTLVISLVMAAAGMLNSVSAANSSQRFAYNSDTDSTGVTTEYVYKVSEDGLYLYHHLKYRYIYDDSQRLLCKEILRWDAVSEDYLPSYALHYTYTADDTVSVELALWSKSDEAYTDVREKAVYAADAFGLTYQAYEYDVRHNVWQMTGEHEVEAMLMADR
ncbi:MAG TPA: DUF3836 domain-containing protein [Candidatus Bacteroides avicola]|uniref:DUF3836 domain-containing protein n=2 Tax=Bacteroidaceae TaxID=815 RepID=A0A9D2HSP2_9BACE|nr:hypothetical protein B5F34_10480 [Mediterranea sp. An20]HJA84609.1 DUF3836 domain-containing protein [Candidatus Bacteroides avicola]